MAKGFFDEDLSESLNAPKHIKGVVCSVKNCKYHDEGDRCAAPCVHIGPGYAASCTDTACATFFADGGENCPRRGHPA